MKSSLCLLSAAALTLCAADSVTNLAADRDAGFEFGRRHWIYSGPYVSCVKGAGLDGSGALQIKAENAPIQPKECNEAYTCFIKVEAGAKYRLSVRYKVISFKSGTIKLQARSWSNMPDRAFTKETQPMGDFNSEPVIPGEPGEWQRMKLEFTIPQGADGLSYSVIAADGFQGHVLFDDVQLIKL